VPAEDFDFASNLQKFNKPATDMAPTLAASTYNKDDFFDTMSSDALEKSGADERQRHRYDVDRRMNLETFGALNIAGNAANRVRPMGGRVRARGAAAEFACRSVCCLRTC
jgi:hypothetical protein